MLGFQFGNEDRVPLLHCVLSQTASPYCSSLHRRPTSLTSQGKACWKYCSHNRDWECFACKLFLLERTDAWRSKNLKHIYSSPFCLRIESDEKMKYALHVCAFMRCGIVNACRDDGHLSYHRFSSMCQRFGLSVLIDSSMHLTLLRAHTRVCLWMNDLLFNFAAKNIFGESQKFHIFDLKIKSLNNNE